MDFEHQLSEDFLLFLELCKKPHEVFEENSIELEMAQTWLHYLATFPSKNINDRRVIDMYMSHLVAALIEGKLFGPFLRDPKDDFLDSAGMDDSKFNSTLLNSTGCPNTTAQYSTTNMTGCENSTACEPQSIMSCCASGCRKNNSSCSGCECSSPYDYSTAASCLCDRSTAGADIGSQDCISEKQITPDFLQNIDATLTLFMDLCKTVSAEGTTQMTSFSQLTNDEFTPSEFLATQNLFGKYVESALKNQDDSDITTTLPPDNDDIKEDISELLNAIYSELRGDVEPGTNDFLERELARYKSFVMAHSRLAMQLTTLATDMKMRHFLLLSLQNDLIKLLSEDFSDNEKK